MKKQQVLLLPDVHLRPECEGVPSGEDTKSLKAVLSYVKTQRWDQVVQIGDLLDLNCISFHNHGKPLLTEKTRLQADFDHASRWLDIWQKATPGAKWTILEGNHEHRVQRYIEAFPVLQGEIEVPKKLGLKGRGIGWVPFWSKGELYQIGNAHFGHGEYLNEYHAKKHLERYGVPFFYGHTHDVTEYSKTTWGNDKTICAKSYGFLGRYDQPYMKGRPSKWQQAFGVFHFQTNGFFNDYCIKIFSNSFTSPDGERFGPR